MHMMLNYLVTHKLGELLRFLLSICSLLLIYWSFASNARNLPTFLCLMQFCLMFQDKIFMFMFVNQLFLDDNTVVGFISRA